MPDFQVSNARALHRSERLPYSSAAKLQTDLGHRRHGHSLIMVVVVEVVVVVAVVVQQAVSSTAAAAVLNTRTARVRNHSLFQSRAD